MKVMIAADYSPPQSGNFIASVIALARRVAAEGGSVVFVFPRERQWANWIRDEGFPIEFVGNIGEAPQTQINILRALVEKYRIDILHLHFGMFHYAATHDRNELGDIRILIHDHMDFSVGSSIMRQYAASAAHSVDYARKNIRVVTVMKRKNKAYLFLRKKWYVPNGLSMERYIGRSMSREECRKTLGICDGEKVCLLLGWDLKRKGLDVALKAVHECRKIDAGIVLGIIGAGIGAPSAFAKEFIREETEFDPDEPWIRYFNNYEDMFAVHRAVDVYISASRKEGFSYGLLEAISQNTPIVVSNIQGTRWAKAYDKCESYPVEDPHACAEAILRALRFRDSPSNAAEIVEKYSIEKWTAAMMSIYKQL